MSLHLRKRVPQQVFPKTDASSPRRHRAPRPATIAHPPDASESPKPLPRLLPQIATARLCPYRRDSSKYEPRIPLWPSVPSVLNSFLFPRRYNGGNHGRLSAENRTVHILL